MAVPLLIIGTVISAVGAISNANAQSNAARYNSQVAQRDAQIGVDQGNAQAAIQARQARSQMDAARAQYGASGVDVNAGSPLDVLQSSAANASLDNATIKYNAKVKAYGYGNEATAYDYQSGAATQKGYWGAGSDILSGGSKVYAARGYSSGGEGTSVYSNQG